MSAVLLPEILIGLLDARPRSDELCLTCSGSTHAMVEGRFIDPAVMRRAQNYFLRMVDVWPPNPDCRVLLGGCPDCRDPDQPKDGRPIAFHQPATGRRSWGDILAGALGGRVSDIELIAVEADRMQAAGEQLGTWLALLIRRVPCPRCHGTGADRTDARGPFTDADGRVSFVMSETGCAACFATGLRLGRHLPDIDAAWKALAGAA